MFYSYDVLHPQKGKFAVVWLVATGRLQFTKRHDKNFKEVMSVKVSRTCDDIMSHVHQKQGQLKFSLYLSTMLFYGTVKVYRRQVRFLLEEVMNIFKNIQRQSELLLDLDVSVPMQMRVTLREPSLIEEPIFDADFFLMPPPDPDSFSLITPRKRALTTPIKKDGKSSVEPSPSKVLRTPSKVPAILRSEYIQEGEDISFLLKDWEETPTRARIEDITLRELPTLMPQESAAALQALGPVDLGPPFYLLEDGPLAKMPDIGDIRKRLDLDGEESITAQGKEASSGVQPDVQAPEVQPNAEQIPIEKVQEPPTEELQAAPVITDHQPNKDVLEGQSATGITDQQPAIEVIEGQSAAGVTDQQLPAIEVTEQQPITEEQIPQEIQAMIDKEAAEATPTKDAAEKVPSRPEKSLPAPPEETPRDPEPAKPLDASQIRLSPVKPKEPRTPVHRRRRKLIIDETTQLSRLMIREQCDDYTSTLRCNNSKQDVGDIYSVKVSTGKNILSTIDHRKGIAAPLKNLIQRHYHTDASLAQFDFDRPARRQLMMDDPRVGPEDISSIGCVSGLSVLESSKESAHRSSESGFIKFKEEQGSIPPPSVDEARIVTAHTPMEERMSEDSLVEAKIPASPLVEAKIPEVSVESPTIPDGQRTAEPPVPEKKSDSLKAPRKRKRVDEGITVASPKRPPTPRQSTFGLFESPPLPSKRGRPSSPEGGFTRHTVDVDIHHQPSVDIRRTEEQACMEIAPAPEVEGHSTPQRSLVVEQPGTEEFVVSETLQGMAPPQIPIKPEDSSVSVGPDVASREFIPSHLSSVRRSASDSMLTYFEVPETYHLSNSQLQQAVEDGMKDEGQEVLFLFKRFLPPGATRRDAANLFSALLEMHKRRKIILSQQRSYGTIHITKLMSTSSTSED